MHQADVFSVRYTPDYSHCTGWNINFSWLLCDEGPTLETLDFTIRISSTPTFLYFHRKSIVLKCSIYMKSNHHMTSSATS